jgi:hypothetical protein
MRTTPSPTRNRITSADVRAQLETFQAVHNVTAETWVEAFRDADGNVVESAEFLEISSLYAMLAATKA